MPSWGGVLGYSVFCLPYILRMKLFQWLQFNLWRLEGSVPSYQGGFGPKLWQKQYIYPVYCFLCPAVLQTEATIFLRYTFAQNALTLDPNSSFLTQHTLPLISLFRSPADRTHTFLNVYICKNYIVT